jgi:hypothetical protein
MYLTGVNLAPEWKDGFDNATQERTLEGVRSTPSLGVGSGRNTALSHHRALPRRVPATPVSNVMAQEALDHRVHLVRYFQLVEVARTHGPAIYDSR